MGLDVK